MKKGLNETRLGAEPIEQLDTDSFINTDSTLSDTGQKNVKEHPKGIRQFHIPDFIENTENQFAQGAPIVFLTAYPLQKDVTGKDQGRAADSQVIADAMEFLAQFKQRFADLEAADQGRAADSQVIADAMEFLAQFKQRFADLEAAFDRPAIAVQTHDFRVGQIGVCGKNDDILISLVPVPDENQLHRNPLFLRFDQN